MARTCAQAFQDYNATIVLGKIESDWTSILAEEPDPYFENLVNTVVSPWLERERMPAIYW